MTLVDNDMRPTLEGTLSDFPITDLLGLLAATRQTGLLQVSVRPAALLTIADGAVAFATTDPAFTVRDLLIAEGLVDAPRWQEAVASGVDIGDLGEALVTAGADRSGLQRAIVDQVVRVCEVLVDEPVARFRFLRQPRSSMGDDFCCPVPVARDRLAGRIDEWARLRLVVTGPAAVVAVREALPATWGQIVIGSADWPVFLAINGAATAAALDATTGLGIYETTRAVVRLWEAGAVVVDGLAAALPGDPLAGSASVPAGDDQATNDLAAGTAPAFGDDPVPAGASRL